MEKVLVSACLIGEKCRYDGKGFLTNRINDLLKMCSIIPICPETIGGLKTPRSPSEIIGDKVINSEGIDVTDQYKNGAFIAEEICVTQGIKYALLKEKSPSCGTHQIYDGSFNKTLISGVGITTQRLKKIGVICYSENEIDLLINELMKNNHE